MNDIEKVIAHIDSRKGEIISDACARVIGALYHGGQSTAGYAFASTGAISDPKRVWDSLFGGYEWSGEDRRAAEALRAYLNRAGKRGPVRGWGGLWL